MDYKPYIYEYNFDWEKVYKELQDNDYDADDWIKTEMVQWYYDFSRHPNMIVPDKFPSVKPGLYAVCVEHGIRLFLVNESGHIYYSHDIINHNLI